MPEAQPSLLGVLRYLTDRPFLAHLALILVGLFPPILIVNAYGPPIPQVHDEFSYMLMAETFANGRLTFPEHPLSEYMETFHVIVKGVYASKYFPLNGLVLAVGILIGHPIFGIWLIAGICGSASYYTAQCFAPKEIAWLGALLCLLQFICLNSWAYTYWGGLPFALSGILVLGGVLHQRDNPSWRHGLLSGIGIGGIILSRPFEGLFFCLPLMVLTVYLLFRHRASFKAAFLGLVLAPLVLTICALAFLGVYNKSITGSPFKTPHTLYHEQYFPDTSRFAWEQPALAINIDRNERFDRFAAFAVKHRPDNLSDLVNKSTQAAKGWLGFYLPWFIALSAGICLVLARGRSRFLLAVLVGLIFARFFFLPLSTWIGMSHYTAAWVAMSLGFLTLGLNTVYDRIGPRAATISGFLLAALLTSTFLRGLFTDYDPGFKEYSNFFPERHDIEEQLYANYVQPHVVFVEYLPEGSLNFEFVYNKADIDSAFIVWLRWENGNALAPAQAYFPHRNYWKLTFPPKNGNLVLEQLKPAGKES